MTKEELIDEVTAYFNHACAVSDCLTAYESIYELADTNYEIVNDYCGFFNISKFCIYRCLLMELAKLYCGSGKEKTLWKLINIIKANGLLFSVNHPIIPVTNALEKELATNDSIINTLRKKRDQDLAHNDPRLFLGDSNILEEYGVSIDDCWVLTRLVADYCNEVLVRLNGKTIIYPTLGSDDLLNVSVYINTPHCSEETPS